VNKKPDLFVKKMLAEFSHECRYSFIFLAENDNFATLLAKTTKTNFPPLTEEA